MREKHEMFENFLPKGGVDEYEGKREELDPEYQIRNSSEIERAEEVSELRRFGGREIRFDLENIMEDSTLYKCMEKDFASSAGHVRDDRLERSSIIHENYRSLY